jgi:mono/diheme cytochrome c family protein
MNKLTVLILVGMVGLAFTTAIEISRIDQPVPVPASPQRSGDATAGYRYLTTGDYIKSGIPYNFFLLGYGKRPDTLLHRDGLNADIPFAYTAVKAANGVEVVAPNCLQCHAEVFDGKLYVGLGNTMIDFSDPRKFGAGSTGMIERLLQKDPSGSEAAAPFLTSLKALGDGIRTEVRGVNAADRLTGLLVAHRDPSTLRWSDQARIQITGRVVPTDVPAWWLLRKKNAMFYNGFGRGDFGRFLMASNLLTVSDSSEAQEVDSHISNVLAYIYSLRPPKYPYPVNQGLARRGGVLFVEHCSKCHGHYASGGTDESLAPGDGGEYPNLLIPESIIGTDSLLNSNDYQSPQIVDWFNRSWFARGDHPARLEPFNGYIAPPLDGIWITAPYLHNGSVPTLEGVLNSRARPAYWSRDFDHPQYDYAEVGWKYKKEDGPRGTAVYNTTLPGYGNQGHSFGDRLSDHDRKAIIEYLKTL